MTDHEERRPSDPRHIRSTLAQIFAEPFMNASHYLASNEIEPTVAVDTGVETWGGPTVEATHVKIEPPETLEDKQAEAQKRLKLKRKEPEA